MARLYLLLLFLYSCLFAAAQQKLTPEEKAVLDSMFAEDEFIKMFLEKDKSYVDISINMGNGAFSIHNPAENATGTADQLILKPSVAYNHKSGLGIEATVFFTNSNSRFSAYQTGLTGFYDHSGKKIKTGISYTRYISDRSKYNSYSLYQDELYGYIKKAKGKFIPGISLGYAGGSYKQVDPWLIDRPFRSDTLVYDTTHNRTAYFSVSASIERSFDFYDVLKKNDGLGLGFSLIVNAGSDETVTTHLNKVFNRRVLSRFKRVQSGNGFQLQSVAMLLQCIYSMGKCYLQPSVYIDHYLPATTAKRWSSIFSLTAGIIFK